MRLVVRTLLIVVLLAAVAAVALGWREWKALHDPFKAYAGEERVVVVESGRGAGSILQLLEAEGVLENATTTRLYLVYRLGDPPLQAGEYRFAGPLSAPEVLAQLIEGRVTHYSVTIPEGLTLEETAAHLAAAGFGRLEVFTRQMRRPEPIADWDPEAETLEGYLFPETYSFPRDTPEEKVVARLVATFRERFSSRVEPLLAQLVDRDRDEAEMEWTVRQVVTLASIIEKEARLDEERAQISAVYHNRLRIGMALYADPTIIFALKQRGAWDGNLRRTDLKLDSPYNTYLYPGLPPGPIASPGLASLQAAVEPADVPYLYFVSRNDGSHVFSRTLSEHNRNVDRWQRQYWRQRWSREQR